MTAQPFKNTAQQPDTTQPEPEGTGATGGPQNATQGRNQWADGYAAARRYYGDTAPIALDKIRDLLAETAADWKGYHLNPDGTAISGDALGYFHEDLRAILDTAQEPHA